MTLKTCSCGKVNTTKNARKLKRDSGMGVDMIYFDCTCGSTFIVTSKSTQARILKYFLNKADKSVSHGGLDGKTKS